MATNYDLFTVGIEEEYTVLNPITKELATIQENLLSDHIKVEANNVTLESNTSVCATINDAAKELVFIRQNIAAIANNVGLWLGASGVHPFSRWRDTQITDRDTYRHFESRYQDIARSTVTFGLHVHIGMESRKSAIYIANNARFFLPHLYALSVNSPFSESRYTGYKSYRAHIFDRFTYAGVPDVFSNIEQYDNYINMLVSTNCINSAKGIYWDLRIHPKYNTLEFRICDVPLTAQESISIAALIQAICVKLYALQFQKMKIATYPNILLKENKWRVSRFGLDAKLIHFDKQVSAIRLINDLLQFVDDVIEPLESRSQIDYIRHMIKIGTGADRQLAVFNETNSLISVVDFVHNQFLQ